MVPDRIGPYPIEREVGRGGMGVVYRARDPRLDRAVAIKVLPDAFARDPDRLARFEREARLLAALTHPNIAGIHGLEEAAGQRFLVLEYVEGDTLAERLASGPLGIAESLDVARQIAAALEAAHEAGIIHRDLKPGNVKITPGGEVKVLDFGLARGAEGSGDASSVLLHSPTISLAATGAGVILGTAAYMSPEQARGKPVDRRTDIWSFGCVLYECLTGKQAFAGETVSDSIAKILQTEPDASVLPAGLPARLRQLLARCLEKDARRRVRDIGDARIEIEELQGVRASGSSSLVMATMPAGAAGGVGAPTRASRRSLVLVALGALAGAAISIALGSLAPRREARPVRFTVATAPHINLDADAVQQAISPDGRTLAFVAADTTLPPELWVRPLDRFEARRLPATRGASLPFWSTDSRSIGFFADGRLKRVRLDGGNPEVICEAPDGRGGTWNRKGTIVFAPTSSGPLFRVSARGGQPEPVTEVDSTKGETAHRWPCFLPDGEHFLFTRLPIEQGLITSHVGSLGSRKRAPAVTAESGPVYAAPGYLVFHRNSSLMAQPFDPAARRLHGDPFTVGPPALRTRYLGSPPASASAAGILSWPAQGNENRRLAWLDRGGREISGLDVPPGSWAEIKLSPDLRRAVITQELPGSNSDLWLLEIERGTMTRLTFGKEFNTNPVWSPDGTQILYSSNRAGPRDVYRRRLDAGNADEVFHRSNVQFKDADAWSPDGRWVLLEQLTPDRGYDLLLMPATGGEPRPLLADPFTEGNADISPDGRWMSYSSDESGVPQAYVQAFPGLGHKQQITRGGSFFATWTTDGRELISLSPDGPSLWSIPVQSGPELKVGTPQRLFRLTENTYRIGFPTDGKRFLAVLATENLRPTISVAVDWRAGLEP